MTDNNIIEIIQDRITAAAYAYAMETGADTYDGMLRDLLGDLRHFADAHDLDFAHEDKAAHEVYTEELLDAQR